MPHDFQSILSLMNVILTACAGIAAIGLYRIVKEFRLLSWEASKPAKAKELEIDMILSSLPNVTYNAYIPGKDTENDILSSIPQITGTACIPGSKIEGRSAEDPTE